MEKFDKVIHNHNRVFMAGNDRIGRQQAIAIAKALASAPRLRILEYLVIKVASLSEIARDLSMPIATASLHLSRLEAAGLVSSHTAPGKRGQKRLYTRLYDTVIFSLPDVPLEAEVDHFETQMPVGAFVDHRVESPCGLAGIDSVIGRLDDPLLFYAPERLAAQMIWLTHGYLLYRFPNYAYERDLPRSLRLSLEICSEAAPAALDWLSDIFIEINGVRLGIWTSPSDFADRRGGLTPAWWPDWNSQYGMLKVWQVDAAGASLDGRRLSPVTIGDLDLPTRPYIAVRIGVDDTAENKGGMNIFGRAFGNHPQDIVMQIDY
ncbi:MAG: helix-turn-helix domain-containing protein [Chloroflexi bacterium]|nr:helix-turn-helix domain-containing protein [Chloroflexota bacterium]MCY4247527.1 helix-turn-helix domain-containing protein [Chloroflexota bacterium]